MSHYAESEFYRKLRNGHDIPKSYLKSKFFHLLLIHYQLLYIVKSKVEVPFIFDFWMLKAGLSSSKKNSIYLLQ